MASCSYCDSFILFGGRTDQTGRYCNDKCQQAGNLLALSHRLPQAQIDQLVAQIHQGNCPKCGHTGPVDVHKAHKVWSALIMTSWSSSPEVSCKSCGVRRQIEGIVFSGFLGWWGFPWGIVMTPVQVVRNIVEMAGGPIPGRPSPLLERIARLHAGINLVQQAEAQPKPPILVAQPAPPPLAKSNPPQGDDRYKPKGPWPPTA